MKRLNQLAQYGDCAEGAFTAGEQALATSYRYGNRLTYSIPDAMDVLGISRATIYSEIKSDRLKTYTVGRRRFVSARAIEAWIAEREAGVEVQS